MSTGNTYKLRDLVESVMWAPKTMWLCKGIIWHLVCSFCRWAGGIWELWESLRRKPLTWTRWLQKGCFSWISILPAPSALPVSKVQFGPCKHEEHLPSEGFGVFASLWHGLTTKPVTALRPEVGFAALILHFAPFLFVFGLEKPTVFSLYKALAQWSAQLKDF